MNFLVFISYWSSFSRSFFFCDLEVKFVCEICGEEEKRLELEGVGIEKKEEQISILKLNVYKVKVSVLYLHLIFKQNISV